MKDDIIVSMLLVTRNSEKFIASALYSLLRQGYKKDRFEIILVDGESKDLTLDIAKQILLQSKISYLILSNVKHTLAHGWNIGIRHARGEYIVRLDAHSELLDNYVKRGIDKLKKDSLLVGVGGVLKTQSKGIVGSVIAKVLCNTVGVGPSLFRVGVQKDTYSDTAVFAVYKKNIFDECGFFKESLKRNQDIDFHRRILACGYKLLTSPNMQANYYSRQTFKDFIVQGFQNGFWIVKSKEYFLRHLIPFLFVCVLFISLFINLKLTFFILIIYFTITTYFFTKRNRFKIIDLLLFNAFVLSLHISYGFGSISSAINLFVKKFSKF